MAGPLLKLPNEFRAGPGIGEGPRPLPAAWECALDGDVLRWAPGVYDLFGLPRGCAIDRRDIVAMYDPESRVLLDQLRSHAIATCGSFTFEAKILRPGGAPRWMLVTADIIVRNGSATHLYGTKLDITAEMPAGR
ncbi:PAS domain-containing protein [Hephaestia caeni]|uniref:PAS domain-containing protein n=1 Tax=Hephaestia caeni TaxID=645617 RepID=UPI001FE37C59|nr:PAS domain-containing protein [Hephaestia caeni]